MLRLFALYCLVSLLYDNRMRELLEPLSLGSGSAVVAVCSAALAWPLCRVRPVTVRWLGAVAVPFALAYVLYWSPVWLGSSDVAQYSAWQFLVVGVWFLAGVTASVVVIFALGRRRAS
jgi:hypothetical protein